MIRGNHWLILAAAGLLTAAGSSARADAVRFHYGPADLCGRTSLKPAGPCGATATRTSWFGLVREPYTCQFRPTHMMTFYHPCTGRNVTVPMTFPEGTPRIEHRADRIVFNYGSYTVEAHFLPDGSVDTVYNSGPFRPVDPY